MAFVFVILERECTSSRPDISASGSLYIWTKQDGEYVQYSLPTYRM